MKQVDQAMQYDILKWDVSRLLRAKDQLEQMMRNGTDGQPETIAYGYVYKALVEKHKMKLIWLDNNPCKII